MIMTRNKVKRLITMLTLALMATICAQAADISGIVVDKANQEPLIGATVMTGDKGTTTDIDGKFTIKGITTRNIHLIIKYIGYKTAELNIATASAKDLKVEMEADEQQFGEVTVTAMANKNSDMAMMEMARVSNQVVNNISAQEIKRTQDNNASEVIRRIPGVSLIEDKFVMVRGLSQRYNNVWINGGAMQQIMVRIRPMKVALPASWTMALIRMEARPVTVMQPAMIPAMAHATATVMAPLAPASSESRTDFALSPTAPPMARPVDCGARSSVPRLRVRKKLMKPTMMAARIE